MELFSTLLSVRRWSGADTNKTNVGKGDTEIHEQETFKTFNNGSLGSRIDEERSELRYVMRIAASVKHRIFERTLRPSVLRGACLSERRYLSQPRLVVGGTREGQPESGEEGAFCSLANCSGAR